MQEVFIEENSLSAYGLISRKLVKSELKANHDLGIRFIHPESEIIEANVANIFSTQRNTVLGKNNKCICLTEHFLAGAAFAKVNNIDVELNEEELPFGDGGAQFWFDFLQAKFPVEELASYSLSEELVVEDENDSSRYISIKPAASLSIKYNLISSNSALAEQSFLWDESMSVDEVLRARTFSSYAENQMLGLQDWVLGFDDNGFKQELYFQNEPARHKLLDLVGDLYLSGINPLALKAEIVSNKAGHELNSKMAIKIKEYFKL